MFKLEMENTFIRYLIKCKQISDMRYRPCTLFMISFEIGTSAL